MFEEYLKINFEPYHGYIRTHITTPLFKVKGEGKKDGNKRNLPI